MTDVKQTAERISTERLGDRMQQMAEHAIRQLQWHDERTQKVHDIIEDLREIILLMPAASRPDGLFQKAQDAVYGMRGRIRLMDDAAIVTPLTELLASRHSDAQEGGEVEAVRLKLSEALYGKGNDRGASLLAVADAMISFLEMMMNNRTLNPRNEPAGASGTKNTVSDERLADIEQWAASEEAECLADEMPVSASYYQDIQTIAQSLRASIPGGVAVKLEQALAKVRYVPGDHPVVPIKHAEFVKDIEAILSVLDLSPAEGAGGKAPLTYEDGLEKALGLMNVDHAFAMDAIRHGDAKLGETMLRWVTASRQAVLREKIRSENPLMGVEDLTDAVRAKIPDYAAPPQPAPTEGHWSDDKTYEEAPAPSNPVISDEFVDKLRIQLLRHREVEIDASGLKAALTAALSVKPQSDGGQP